MRSVTLATAALLGMTALSALAQVPSGVASAGAHPNIAPTLPPPGVGDDAATRDYLRVARNMLAEGRTGQAGQALEMAETQALDRSVPQGQADAHSNTRLISQIRDARRALAGSDLVLARQLIDLALAS